MREGAGGARGRVRGGAREGAGGTRECAEGAQEGAEGAQEGGGCVWRGRESGWAAQVEGRPGKGLLDWSKAVALLSAVANLCRS